MWFENLQTFENRSNTMTIITGQIHLYYVNTFPINVSGLR